MITTIAISILAASTAHLADGERAFTTHQLAREFFCEGACFGDFNGDGAGDVAAGPYWYEGPGFSIRHRLYEARAFDVERYSDNFFAWARDLDGDGAQDLIFVGFPGKQAWWLRNPGRGEGIWTSHLIHANVDNESPALVDIDGDGFEDLVAHTGGTLAWFERDPIDPTAPWLVHRLSETMDLNRFTHGLGVGDVDGDGRLDVLLHRGWWRQPETLEGDPIWEGHPYRFGAGYGGAQMLVTDVDGDGDNDVVTSLKAHSHGLSWFEQVSVEGRIDFVERPIMGSTPGEHDCPLAVSELHALDLVDLDGDGLKDIITGKRFMSHSFREPGAREPAYLLWFRLVRDAQGVRYVPHVIHDDSGVGVQVSSGDVNGDGLPDIVSANKKGTFVHLQSRVDGPTGPDQRRLEPATEEASEVDEGFLPAGGFRPLGRDGEPLNLGFEKGTLEDWTAEGEAFAGQPVHGDTVAARRDMTSDHAGKFWMGGYELLEDGPVGTLTSAPFEVTHAWAVFLIAGGNHPETRVELVLVEDDELIESYTGRDQEALRPVVVDLSAHLGHQLYVRLVDEHTGHWGHLNFDELRFYTERPVLPDGVEVFAAVRVEDTLGLAPEQAALAMTVPDGFAVQLVAGEPDVHQPIALTFDERGRLWVAEAHSYPAKRAPEDAHDRILIFEDQDADGSFETRSVFVEGLNLVSGLEVGYGGVYVGAAPELLFFPDADRDDTPDGPPEVLLDGWGYQDTHETLNAFTWGPDGWLYGCHGVFTHSRVGPPGTPDAQREPINAGVWRYHPTRHDFEVFAWGSSNPWGVDFDDRGRAFITACVIPHLFHLTQGGRYARQAGSHFNPHVYADIATIADHLHYSGETPWKTDERTDGLGGGHAHCGAMIYLGDSWPERYRNTLFVSNIHGNRLNNELLEPDRSGFVGRHGDDFLKANDPWFRGINMKYGPDGSVCVLDWYDKRACHNNTPEIWNRTNGRIYRVVYEDAAPVQVDLWTMDEAQLVELCLHRNDWFVRNARRLLGERGLSAAGQRRLEEILTTHADEGRRLRALWCLHAGGALELELLRSQLESEHEMLRAWAVQLACERRAPTREFLLRMQELAAADPSPIVRLYLASALQRLPLRHRWGLARALVARTEDADDPNIPHLLWYGIEPLVPENPTYAMALARACALPSVGSWIWRRAAAEDGAHPALITALAGARDDTHRKVLLDAVLEGLGDRRGVAMPSAWPAVRRKLEGRADPEVRHRALILAALFGDEGVHPRLLEWLADSQRPDEERELAFETLLAAREPAMVSVLCKLLDEQGMRPLALRGLAAFDHPRVPRAILASFGSFDELQRRDAVSTLTARVPSALALLDAVEAGAVPRTQLTALELRKLSNLANEEVMRRLGEVWGVFREPDADKRAELERWKETLGPERLAAADLSLGRDVYARTCMRCHRLYGEGIDLGPDITGANRSDLDYLLENIVDPNAVIPKEYRVTIVLTTDGRVVTGILLSADDEVVRLQTENEVVILGREEIEALKEDDNSMMPQGQLDTLSEEEAAALLAYLLHDAQVPRRVTLENAAGFFDGESLLGWHGEMSLWDVEQGTIVGRTTGLARNEFLVSDLEVGDFRLTFEIKLDPDGENSGVQFRSRELEGRDVAGYQADIGRGWWGNLYEEHGRGTLAEIEMGDGVRRGDWNRYEILAVGGRIRTAINGRLCVDFEDPEPTLRGVIALQMHSGGPLEVRFRGLQLEVDPDPELKTLSEGQ